MPSRCVAVEVRARSGEVVDAQKLSGLRRRHGVHPGCCPRRSPGSPANANHEQVVYFTAPSQQPGGPIFRVRASTLANGNVLIVAQSAESTPASTLHQLLVIELAVTGGAVVVALVGGFWLVRIGLRPLRDMETTAESIAAGNLTERVPGRERDAPRSAAWPAPST